MEDMTAPAGWYPDPDGSGGQRYFDGGNWTGHRWPPPPDWAPVGGYQWGGPPWKGAELGRPAGGPGALADPGRRLGARFLDGLVMMPVLAALVAVAVAVVAPHAGPLFPVTNHRQPRRPGADAGDRLDLPGRPGGHRRQRPPGRGLRDGGHRPIRSHPGQDVVAPPAGARRRRFRRLGTGLRAWGDLLALGRLRLVRGSSIRCGVSGTPTASACTTRWRTRSW